MVLDDGRAFAIRVRDHDVDGVAPQKVCSRCAAGTQRVAARGRVANDVVLDGGDVLAPRREARRTAR